MRIAQILLSLDAGGLERLAIDLAREQNAGGHETFLYCTKGLGALAAYAQESGIPVEVFGKREGFSVGQVRHLAAFLRARRIEVVHTHNALVHHYGVVAARLEGARVVVNTRHTPGSWDWDPKRERLFRLTRRWTDALVSVSGEVHRYFVTEGGWPEAKARVILNGIRLDRFADPPARPGTHAPVFRFGAVGRLAPQKDHVTMVRAFAAVSAKLPGAELHILGEGPSRPEIEQCIRSLGLEDRVFLPGYSADVAGFLRRLDVFVLSSISEGLPLAVIEAMAAGLPVVSTKVPGVAEIAVEGEVGWFCAPGQPESLASLMLAVAAKADLPAIGRRSADLAAPFSVRRCWAEYEALFEELLAARAGR